MPLALKGEFDAYRGLVLAAVGQLESAEEAFHEAITFSRYVDATAVSDLGSCDRRTFSGERTTSEIAVSTLRNVIRTAT